MASSIYGLHETGRGKWVPISLVSNPDLAREIWAAIREGKMRLTERKRKGCDKKNHGAAESRPLA